MPRWFGDRKRAARHGRYEVRAARGGHRTWQGSMPGNLAHVGLMRLSGGRSSASLTTCSLKSGSYDMRRFDAGADDAPLRRRAEEPPIVGAACGERGWGPMMCAAG